MVKQGDAWVSKMITPSVDWPHHIIDGKTAFLSVTQSCLLQLVYQQDGQSWSVTSTTLGDGVGAEDILTHSAFADSNQFIYVATFSNRGCLRLYKVSIEWTRSSSDETQNSVLAQLSVEGLQVVGHCQPKPAPDAKGMSTQDLLQSSRLSKLGILPFHSPSAPDSDAFHVVAIFTRAESRTDFGIAVGHCSCIVRWEIVREEPEILDVFKTFKAGNNKMGNLDAITTLNRLDDFTTAKVVLGVEPIHSEDILGFTYSDGFIEFRQRDSLELVSTSLEDDSRRAGYLAHCGFQYNEHDRCTEIALAPDACMAAVIGGDGKLALRTMNYFLGWKTADLGSDSTQRAISSIAREVAILTSLQTSADELFALVPWNLPTGHRRFFMRQIYKILQRPVDFTSEDNRKFATRALRDAITTKTFSLQLHLGYRDRPGQFDQAGKLAYIALNLKSIATCLAQTVSTKETVRADSIISLRHCIRWVADLIILVLDDLYKIHQWRQTRGATFVLSDLNDYIREMNSASLMILLCATPRSLLRMMLELIKAYFGKAIQCLPQNGAQRALIQETIGYSKMLPFKLPIIDALILEVENSIRMSYKMADANTQQRIDAELTMLVDGEVPLCLSLAAEQVTGNLTSKLQDSFEMSKIIFVNTDWLGLRDSDTEDGPTQRRKYDVIRKTPITEGMKVRSCRRCGSVVEDAYVGMGERERMAVPPWLAQAQRFCICLGYWMLESR